MPEELSDAILLERFVSRREEAAFVALVKRHGPLVEGICRRVLRNEHDVQDVSQATFLVLARKAAGIPWRESVGGWLGSVAHRLALGARSDLSRQYRREASFTTVLGNGAARDGRNGGWLPEIYHPVVDQPADVERRDLRGVLDDELLRLPEKYRAPVVLCDLQGRSHEEAARRLGCPSGSMSRRLARARGLLRRRLILRGITLAIGMLGLTLALLAVWATSHSGRPATVAIGETMAPLGRLMAGKPSVERMLASADHRPTGLADRDQVISLASLAARVAERIEAHDPGKDRDRWRESAVEMRRSAVVLAQAAQVSDSLTMLSAARRLDASCLNCHEVFRQ
jgi:RNA polymerase sigma-70 factor (ECF subfamily)